MKMRKGTHGNTVRRDAMRRRGLSLLLALILLCCAWGWAEEDGLQISAGTAAEVWEDTGAEEASEIQQIFTEEEVCEVEGALPLGTDEMPENGSDEAQTDLAISAPEETAVQTEAEASQPTEETALPAEDQEQPSENPDEQQDQEPGIALERSSLNLGVKEKYRLTLTDGTLPSSVGAVFSTSNSRIVAVNWKTGEVTGKKVGTATVTMMVGDAVSTCEVHVLKAPSKLTVTPTKLTMGVGEERSLAVKLPKNTASVVTFYSSDSRVARVDYEGHIIAVKKGNAAITARTFNGKQATCKITVKAAPKSVALKPSVLSMWVGDTHTLSPAFSKNSAGGYSYALSDDTVASIKGDTLKALAEGSTTVTVTSYNGLTAEMSVQISRKPVYRALLIGESSFPGTGLKSLPGKKDTALMQKMLKSVTGPAGSKWNITNRTNRTAGEILSDIQSAFSGAQEGDMSLFYISTHGDQDESIEGDNGEYAGALVTYPDKAYSNWYEQNTLSLPRLAQALAEVPGQVIVLIDSCGSGAAVYTPKGISAPPAFDPGSFDRAVVDAFEAEDRAVMAPGLEEGAFVMRNKFYVLTSADYLETGWSTDSYSYFTKWLTDGIGTRGIMPADSNKNKKTTLSELYSYITDRAEKKPFKYKGDIYYQHVQVYPANCGVNLFCRK